MWIYYCALGGRLLTPSIRSAHSRLWGWGVWAWVTSSAEMARRAAEGPQRRIAKLTPSARYNFSELCGRESLTSTLPNSDRCYYNLPTGTKQICIRLYRSSDALGHS
jgi:hypothetical protein